VSLEQASSALEGDTSGGETDQIYSFWEENYTEAYESLTEAGQRAIDRTDPDPYWMPEPGDSSTSAERAQMRRIIY
jgi:hypothetical protein